MVRKAFETGIGGLRIGSGSSIINLNRRPSNLVEDATKDVAEWSNALHGEREITVGSSETRGRRYHNREEGSRILATGPHFECRV